MEKITLRKYKISDLDRHLTLLAQNKVYSSKFTARKKESIWLNKAISNYKASKPEFYALTIVLNKKIIGNIVAEKISRKEGANIGFWIGEPYWGKGYTTKALKLFLNMIHRKFGIKTTTAEYKKENIASGKVLVKNGFKQVKSKKKGIVKLVKKF